jgi:hypothetical protein
VSDYSHELGYWESPINRWVEMGRHYLYAEKMGILVENFWFRVNGKSILDIGGGPCSMLLQTWDATRPTIIDPCPYPAWVRGQYDAKGVWLVTMRGEDLDERMQISFDEAWIYNVLQHVDDPAQVVANARKAAKLVRIFEWIDIPPYEGHPHMLTKMGLDTWLETDGQVGEITDKQWNIYAAKYYAAVKET